ncbi:MAG: hypothetical protein M1481_05305 [Candidatus Thermoplasmatota archaeon]|nr:hypothetical protein [Candidatus Thermoplasmatota archaeon]
MKEFKNKFNAYEDGQRIKDSDRKSIDEQMDGMWKNFVNDNLAEKILLTERDDLILDIKKLHKGTKGFF